MKYDDNLSSIQNKEKLLHELGSVENIENFLALAYTSNIGVEFEHLTNFEEKAWLYEQFESLMSRDLTQAEKHNNLSLMVMSEV